MVHLRTMNVSMADGLLFSSICQLLNWMAMFGALVGLAGVLFHADNKAVVHTQLTDFKRPKHYAPPA